MVLAIDLKIIEVVIEKSAFKKSLDYNAASGNVSREQISLIIGENFVISLHENSVELFTSVQNRIRNAQGRIRKMRSGYLAYALIDVIVDHYFIVRTYANAIC